MAHTLVTFHAHPDDEALLTAGTMARAAAEGHRVVLVVATAGEVGDAAADLRADPEKLAAVRREELARSAAILGVARVVELGYGDSGLDGPTAEGAFTAAPVEEAAERLAAVLREEDADVLTTYDEHGGYGHRDHVRVHAVGHRAAELAGTPVVLEATINRDLMAMGVQLATSLGYEIPADFNPASLDDWFTAGDAITHTIDVSAHLAQKRASMEAHESQTSTAGEGTRTLAAFLSLPEEYFALAFGTEWFVERGRPTEPAATDVFAGLDP